MSTRWLLLSVPLPDKGNRAIAASRRRVHVAAVEGPPL